jgi:hypothetical protein
LDVLSNGENGDPRIEMARSSSAWTWVTSYTSSIAHVLWTVFFGYLVSLRLGISPMVFMFVAASKLFSIVLTEGSHASKKTRVHSAIALASLIPLLIGLSFFEIAVGILILTLYSLYPIFSERAPFDLVHHALRYVLIFMIGYGSLAFFNETALLALSAVVLFSVAGELLAGMRKSGGSSSGAASLLGIKRSVTAIVPLIFTGSVAASLALNNLFEFPVQINETSVPFYIIPALALDLYLTRSLVKVAGEKRVDAFHLIRKKELMVIAVMLLLILVVFQTARIGTKVTVSSEDYSFSVGIRTIIAGPNSWDVPWIVFNYINESNYYYVVFHKDGVLELSLKLNGQYVRYVSSLETLSTPFQWHSFHIVLNETTVTVNLDGEYQVATSRSLVADASNIIVSPSTPNPTGIWIACMYSIILNP